MHIFRRLAFLRDLARLPESVSAIRSSVSSIQRQLERQHSFSVMRMLDFDLEYHPRYADPRRLLRYAFQACSQNAEDGMIHEIFRRIGTGHKCFVELGVGDGNENNTAFLISKGWRGLWVDGDPEFLTTLRDRGWLASGQVKGTPAFVSKENASALLESASVPSEFDLLSIDLDQNTYYVWQALASFHPRVVVVEYNAAFPPDVEWVVTYRANATWDGSQNFGASLRSFQLLGQDLGYNLVGCDFTGVNAFFVRTDLCDEKFASPFSSENHYEPPRYAAFTRRSHPTRAFDSSVRENCTKLSAS
jgi:hypothetical protein